MSTQEPPGQPSEEELREAMKQLKVEDVLVQTVVTLVNLSGRKLTVEEEKDLEQAKTGIEAVRALLPLCPQEGLEPVRDALSQLQMVFAREAGQPTQEPKADEPPAKDPGRAKARSKLWTPPGT